jgi:putative addiction module component (TIGR02574 family)
MACSKLDIKNDIRALTPEERRDLLASLIRELDGAAVDPNVEKLWLAEAERRSRELVDGKVEGIPAHLVFERLRSRLAE